ncbi:uncharacterized protein LOC129757695 [Uranotaenia lowii]|uniref:uncharacterized protein LOC129757695 n=1 Tax=Uranotaenia lowii TaxID=190385 RepID=UPI00247870E3|nr:uncharacterized protein LOC129757695 [Uranotaenia lowii]
MKDTLKAMAVSSSRGDSVTGVKGISPLIRIPNFDVIRNCPIDYMHGVLLGVCRQLCRLWFETPSCRSYIKNKINLIDLMLTSMDPFVESSRNARKISDRNSWKANEWLQWLLHYSPVCLKSFLPQEYYDHYYLLVSSITLMVQDEISPETFSICENMLQSFVSQFENLYGIQEMTYNVHLVSHLVDCSKDYGPLWAFSLFVYEDINGLLKKYVKGPKEPIIQIANRCIMAHMRFNTNVTFMQPNLKKFWNKLNKTQTKYEIKTNGFYRLNNSIKNSYNEKMSFEKVNAFVYKGFLYKPKSTIESISRHGRKAHNDCYFSMYENSKTVFGEIHYILNDGGETFFLYTEINVTIINEHSCRLLELGNLALIKVNNSLFKYIKMQIDDMYFFCKLQCKLHID